MADKKQPPRKKLKTTNATDAGNEEPIADEFCDPDNPKIIHFEDVSAAAIRTKDVIQKTPCGKSKLSSLLGMEIYFKKEFLQYTGSFKERGARYTLLMLSAEQKSKGVITASAGNHALALAFHGQSLGIPVTVVMPTIAPIMKIQACKTYGASIVIDGDNICESRKKALSLGKSNGQLYINGYDHPHILAGQGTMGLEIVDQVPDLDACIIPVGGGGLIAGTALAIKSLKPLVKIYGVESERCASFSEALKAGKPTWTSASSSIADGLAVPLVGVNAFATARSLIEDIRVVKEEFIALAILRLLELEKAVVEGAGAVGLAALIQGLCPELKGKKVVVALCGGNIDTTALGRVIERGLAADRRLIRFVVTVSDRPAGIAQLTTLVASLGVSIHDIFHERAWLKNDVFATQVKCVVETRDESHAQELHQVLRDNYEHLLWGPTEF